MNRAIVGTLAALAGAAVLAQAPTAGATAFAWSYSGINGSTVSASGTLTATPLGGGAYKVTSISGLHDGSAITGLTSYAIEDQTVYTTYPQLDYLGLAFLVGAAAYNVYYDTSTTDPYSCGFVGYCQVGPGVTGSNGIGDGEKSIAFTLIVVPEPATWALLSLGFGALGAALRARRPLTAGVF